MVKKVLLISDESSREFEKVRDNIYRLASESQSITLEFYDGGAYWILQTEAGKEWAILTPAYAPDPRSDYLRCEGGVRQFLRRGHEGRSRSIGMRDSIPKYYLSPDGDEAGQIHEFVVVGDPICIDGIAWWEVTTNDLRVNPQPYILDI